MVKDRRGPLQIAPSRSVHPGSDAPTRIARSVAATFHGCFGATVDRLGAYAMSVLERDEMRIPIRFDLPNESDGQWDIAERTCLCLAGVERPPEKIHRNGRTTYVLRLFVHNHERGRRDWIKFRPAHPS